MKRFLPLMLLFIAAIIGYWHIQQQPAWSAFTVPAVIPTMQAHHANSTEGMESVLLPATGAMDVHAASLITLTNGNIMAFWFEGSREGANDVVIQSAVLNTKTQTWHEPVKVIDRAITQKGLWRYISKLGNPVPTRTPDGQLQLFIVTASVGGWSTSSITMIVSDDDGVTWHRPQRLITSPFFNMSTLVKSPALMFADGRLGLPVYHELFGKFGELLRMEIATAGVRVIDKRRMSSGRGTLQPIIFIDDAADATAYFRQARIHSTDPNRIPSSGTMDAGKTWQVGADLPLANPNAAVAGLTLSNGDRLLVLNDLEHGRYRLALAISRPQLIEGQHIYSAWKIVKILEDESHLPERYKYKFSYPYLIADAEGNVHLVYTFNNNRIKHTRFTADWFAQMK